MGWGANGGGGGVPSFTPPITPAITGSPGSLKVLTSDAGGVVDWTNINWIVDPGGNGYLKETGGVISNVSPIPISDLQYSTITVNTAGTLTGGGSVSLGGTLNLTGTGIYIPAGTGFIFENAGVYSHIATITAPIVGYTPAMPGNWPIVVSEVATALDSLSAQIIGLSSQIHVSFPHVWYVSSSVAASGIGSINAPFKTIAAAMTAASAGDLVFLGPGTYTEIVTITKNVSIRGSGKHNTFITAPAASTQATLRCVPGSGTFTAGMLCDLSILNNETGVVGSGAEVGSCLYLDGNGIAVGTFTSFFTTGFVMQDVLLDKGSSTGDGYYLRCVDKMFVSQGIGTNISGNVSGWRVSGMLVNPGYLFVESTILGDGVNGFSHSYDDTAGQIRPVNGRQGVVLCNATTVYGGISFAKAPLFSMAQDTAMFGDMTAPAGSLAIFTSPAHAPSIRVAGTIGSYVLPCTVQIAAPAITAPAVAAGALPYVDFSGAVLYLSSTKTFTVTGNVGVVRFNPIAYGARFISVPEVSPTTKVFAGAETDLDIRTSWVRQDSLAVTGNGTINRSMHRILSVSSPSTQTITPPYPSSAVLTAHPAPTTAVACGATVTATNVVLTGTATVNIMVQSHI